MSDLSVEIVTKMEKSRYISVSLLPRVLVVSVLAVTLVDRLGFGQEYRYDRLWPSLQQPWYFNEPQGIAIENEGGILIVDSKNARVQKYTSNGQLLTEWGTPGSESGEFEQPADVAVDGDNNVYVTDTYNHRVQVFTPDGQFVRAFGEIGSGPGQFNGPEGIVVDSQDRIYVADSPNFRISVFERDGAHLFSWGVFGDGPGQFTDPSGLALTNEGSILVTDSAADRVQQFSLDGAFINQWGGLGETDGRFDRPIGIAVDAEGIVYVADTNNRRVQQFNLAGEFLGTYETGDHLTRGITAPDRLAIHPDGSLFVTARRGSRVLKFSAQRKFLNEWSSKSALPGRFDIPWGITVAPSGDVYATDSFNHRVQRFTAEGRILLQWGEEGSLPGAFKVPYGIASDSSGNLYVTDYVGANVQRFTPDGEMLLAWGAVGSGDGEFRGPASIAIAPSGDVYVADSGNNRIQQFTSDGAFVRAFGSEGEEPGQLRNPFGVAVDGEGFVYVADTRNSRVQKFSASGEFLLGWGAEGDGLGQFDDPSGLTTDSDNRVFVADSLNHRIQVFSPEGVLLSIFGSRGTNPGQLFRPETLALATDGTAYIADTFNSRIQRFVPFESVLNKAIILAGGDAHESPEVLRAAEMCTNVAYRALLQQGYSKETIFFMRTRTDVDLDQNGLFDDVDALATSDNLEDAIINWGRDASNLVLYLVGPGETGGFRPGADGLISGAQLDAWLDILQQSLDGTVLTLYDASFAGKVIPALASNGTQKRATIASAGGDEPAYFVSDGTVSYSNLFWVNAFNGSTLQEAAARASINLSKTAKFQTPEVDGNGNGIPNESEDDDFLASLQLLFEALSTNQPPELGAAGEPQLIGPNDTVAELTLARVLDDEGIVSLVRGVVTPPGFSAAPGQEGITQLPTVDLFSGDDNTYRGSFSQFEEPGTYTIDFYALDANLNVSDIQRTTVRKAEFSASLGGVIVDRVTRAPLTIAEVLIQEDQREIGRTSPDSEGFYVVLSLESGPYSLSASASGYTTQTQIAMVQAGELALLNFELEAAGPLVATPPSLDFDKVVVGEFAELTLTVTNTGGELASGSATTSAPFEIRGGDAYAMEPGHSYSMTVRFAPSEVREYAAAVLLTGGGGMSIALNGSGVQKTGTGIDCSPGGASGLTSMKAHIGDSIIMVVYLLVLGRWRIRERIQKKVGTYE